MRMRTSIDDITPANRKVREDSFITIFLPFSAHFGLACSHKINYVNNNSNTFELGWHVPFWSPATMTGPPGRMTKTLTQQPRAALTDSTPAEQRRGREVLGCFDPEPGRDTDERGRYHLTRLHVAFSQRFTIFMVSAFVMSRRSLGYRGYGGEMTAALFTRNDPGVHCLTCPGAPLSLAPFNNNHFA